jgi:antitoxin HicB
MIKYQARIYKDGTAYSVEFPDLDGCFSFGETIVEAKAMAKEALSLYLEEARDATWKIPVAKTRKSSSYHWITPSHEVAIPLMIRQKRLEQGFTQAQLAKKLGVSTQQVQKLETPGKSNPTVKTLYRISSVLDTELEVYWSS